MEQELIQLKVAKEPEIRQMEDTLEYAIGKNLWEPSYFVPVRIDYYNEIENILLGKMKTDKHTIDIIMDLIVDDDFYTRDEEPLELISKSILNRPGIELENFDWVYKYNLKCCTEFNVFSCVKRKHMEL
eukprot:UN26027